MGNAPIRACRQGSGRAMTANADKQILKIVKMRDAIKNRDPVFEGLRGAGMVIIRSWKDVSGRKLRTGRSRKIWYFKQFINYYIDYASRFSYFWECGG